MTDYTRHKNIVSEMGLNPIRCESINSAKRLSRKLQRQGHTVHVISHQTKAQRVRYVKPWRPE